MTETEGRAGETVVAAQAGGTPAVQSDEVAALRERAERAERENAVRNAIRGIEWFEAEDAYRELTGQAERDEAGGYSVAVGSQRVAIDEAARQLAARKPHWVRAKITGGSGANGGTGSAAGGPAGISYADLIKPQN